MTSSLALSTAMNAMYRQCFPPAPVVICSGLYGRPFSRLNFSAMACFSSGRQGVGVYLVCPLSSAALAASLMNPGVSKSGSPAPKPTTSTPLFFNAAALALTAKVIDSEINFIRSARGNMNKSSQSTQSQARRGQYEQVGVDSSRNQTAAKLDGEGEPARPRVGPLAARGRAGSPQKLGKV